MLISYELEDPNNGPLARYQIIRRSGSVVPFEPSRIFTTMMKALMAQHRTVACIVGSVFQSGNLPSAKRQDLHLLSQLAATKTKLRPGKESGFFSVSKANLRNAP